VNDGLERGGVPGICLEGMVKATNYHIQHSQCPADIRIERLSNTGANPFGS
jgi:hypothetical protein